LDIPALTQDAKISPKIDFGGQKPTTVAKAKPGLSAEEERKRGAEIVSPPRK
jgi:hypothetical protein